MQATNQPRGVLDFSCRWLESIRPSSHAFNKLLVLGEPAPLICNLKMAERSRVHLHGLGPLFHNRMAHDNLMFIVFGKSLAPK